jgi:hypothetical protein
MIIRTPAIALAVLLGLAATADSDVFSSPAAIEGIDQMVKTATTGRKGGRKAVTTGATVARKRDASAKTSATVSKKSATKAMIRKASTPRTQYRNLMSGPWERDNVFFPRTWVPEGCLPLI